jgi:hypothetical protein
MEDDDTEPHTLKRDNSNLAMERQAPKIEAWTQVSILLRLIETPRRKANGKLQKL